MIMMDTLDTLVETKQLLVEYIGTISPNAQLIEESIRNGKKLVVSGVLQRSDSGNQNGRLYPHGILMREADKYQSMIQERRALGELDHPDSSVVNLSNVSHNIVEMHWKGKDLIGTIEVLTTPAGNILKELFRNGIKVGISSRALGTTQESNGYQEVQEDLELIAFDMVSNPSTHGAFMNKLHEGTRQQQANNPYQNINRLITDILIEMKTGN